MTLTKVRSLLLATWWSRSIISKISELERHWTLLFYLICILWSNFKLLNVWFLNFTGSKTKRQNVSKFKKVQRYKRSSFPAVLSELAWSHLWEKTFEAVSFVGGTGEIGDFVIPADGVGKGTGKCGIGVAPAFLIIFFATDFSIKPSSPTLIVRVSAFLIVNFPWFFVLGLWLFWWLFVAKLAWWRLELERLGRKDGSGNHSNSQKFHYDRSRIKFIKKK